MSTHIPYTYLIGWSKHNLWYYGSRTAKNCNPADLWKTYYTSSDFVKFTIEDLGDPDVIQIRKTFTSKASCLKWEHTVLRRMKVNKNPIWLNVAFISPSGHLVCDFKKPMTDKHKANISKGRKGIKQSSPAWNKGIPMTEEAKQHLSNINKGKPAWNKGIPNDAARGVPRSDDVKQRISQSLKGRPRTAKQMEGKPHSEETKKKIKDIQSQFRWYHNNDVSKRFHVSDTIPEGFIPGRLNFNPHKNK